jgi:hypothetical protein
MDIRLDGNELHLSCLRFDWLLRKQNGSSQEHGPSYKPLLEGHRVVSWRERILFDGSRFETRLRFATGKLADLVIVDKNPPETIENTASIRFVMKGGQLYSGETLAELWPVQRPAWTPWREANHR